LPRREPFWPTTQQQERKDERVSAHPQRRPPLDERSPPPVCVQADRPVHPPRARRASRSGAGRRRAARPDRADPVLLGRHPLDQQLIRLDNMYAGGRDEDVAAAQAGLDAAQAKLELLRKGATQDIRQAAQSAVDTDSAAVAAAEAALANVPGSVAADLAQAQG